MDYTASAQLSFIAGAGPTAVPSLLEACRARLHQVDQLPVPDADVFSLLQYNSSLVAGSLRDLPAAARDQVQWLFNTAAAGAAAQLDDLFASARKSLEAGISTVDLTQVDRGRITRALAGNTQ